MKLKAKQISFFILLGLLPFVFSGCLGQGSKKPQEPTILTVWRAIDDEDIFREAVKGFEAANPNIKVKVVKKNQADYEVDSLNLLASQKGPDVWSIRSDWMERHRDKLVSAPAGILARDKKDKRTNLEVLKEKFVPVVADDMAWENKIYGLPLAMDTLALFYNEEIFREARRRLEKENVNLTNNLVLTQAPKTWDEFVETVRALKMPAAGIGSSKNSNRGIDLLMAIMLQNKTEMTSADNQTASFNLPGKKETGEQVLAGLLALDFYTSFATGSKGYQAWSKDQPDSLKMFMEGKLPMLFGYGRDAQFLRSAAPNLRFKIVPFPQIKGGLEAIDYASYWVETVTKSSKNPTLAWKFVKELAINYAGSYQSATRLASAFRPTDKYSFQDRAESTDPFKYQAVSAKSWNKGREPTKIDRVFNEMIDNVLNGLSVQISLDNGAKEVTKLLRQEE